MILLVTAGVVTIDGTVIVELITFLAMLAILSRYVFPEVVKFAEARQRLIAQQLKDAEQARKDAETHLKEAEAKVNEARRTAQSVIDGANKAAEQLRLEGKHKPADEAKRPTAWALKKVEYESARARHP